MDIDGVLAHFADDATLTVQTDHVTFTGAAEIRRMFTDFFGASVSIGHEIRNIVVEPGARKVATEQGYFGELKDGSKNDMHNCNFFDFNEDGKFTPRDHLDGRDEPAAVICRRRRGRQFGLPGERGREHGRVAAAPRTSRRRASSPTASRAS